MDLSYFYSLLRTSLVSWAISDIFGSCLQKENVIAALNAKIRELESTLARLLKEREKETKGTVGTSLVDISVWLSSPREQGVPSVNVFFPSFRANSGDLSYL